MPVALSFAAAVGGHALLPDTLSLAATVAAAAGILVLSLVVLAVADRLARRFLPLAALLQLSLVFPDQTPSRFRLALKGGSGRRLAKVVETAREDGLSDIPSVAAEQLLLMAGAIGDHDRRTRGHSERVRLYAELIGEELHLSADERAKLQWAALVHDIGKVTVPPEILNKKGKPDDKEWALLQGHPLAGEDLAAPAEAWLGEWIHAVGGHHEKWDGSGYPRGLAGDDIPRAAAIVAVADSFEVMTAVRSYKKAMPLADARRELTRCAGRHFSPEVVRAFLQVSIGDLRRSMGVFASLAHVPLLGRITTVAAHAPDAVSTTVGVTTSAASASAGAVAVSAVVAVGGPSAALAASPAPAPAAVVHEVEERVVTTVPVSSVASAQAFALAGGADVEVLPPSATTAAVPSAPAHVAAVEADDEDAAEPRRGRTIVAASVPVAPVDGPKAEVVARADERAEVIVAKAEEKAAKHPEKGVEVIARAEEKAVEVVARAEAKAVEAVAKAEEKAAKHEEQAVRAEAKAAEQAVKAEEQAAKAEERAGAHADKGDGHGNGQGGGGKQE